MKAIALLILLLARATAAEDPAEADAPIAPIAAAPAEGWSSTITLRNDALEVVVAPAAGRIVRIACRGGDNLFRLDPALAGYEPGPARADRWANVGGDWFWPVAQSRWKDFAASDWPPPPALAEQPWQAAAWKTADGGQCCRVTREYGEPLNLRATRLVRLEPGAPRLAIRQSLTRTAESKVPAVLWNISQVGGAERVILPTDTPSLFDRGFKPLMFGDPPETHLAACDQAIVYDTAAGEHKLCSDSERGWVAAGKGGVLLVERTEGGGRGKHPDGGCTVEMYSNAGLGYSEIETLSVEKDLQPGETLQNTLIIECLDAPPGAEPCALAEHVRKALGELRSDIPPVK